MTFISSNVEEMAASRASRRENLQLPDSASDMVDVTLDAKLDNVFAKWQEQFKHNDLIVEKILQIQDILTVFLGSTQEPSEYAQALFELNQDDSFSDNENLVQRVDRVSNLLIERLNCYLSELYQFFQEDPIVPHSLKAKEGILAALEINEACDQRKYTVFAYLKDKIFIGEINKQRTLILGDPLSDIEFWQAQEDGMDIVIKERSLALADRLDYEASLSERKGCPEVADAYDYLSSWLNKRGEMLGGRMPDEKTAAILGCWDILHGDSQENAELIYNLEIVKREDFIVYLQILGLSTRYVGMPGTSDKSSFYGNALAVMVANSANLDFDSLKKMAATDSGDIGVLIDDLASDVDRLMHLNRDDLLVPPLSEERARTFLQTALENEGASQDPLVLSVVTAAILRPLLLKQKNYSRVMEAYAAQDKEIKKALVAVRGADDIFTLQTVLFNINISLLFGPERNVVLAEMVLEKTRTFLQAAHPIVFVSFLRNAPLELAVEESKVLPVVRDRLAQFDLSTTREPTLADGVLASIGQKKHSIIGENILIPVFAPNYKGKGVFFAKGFYDPSEVVFAIREADIRPSGKVGEAIANLEMVLWQTVSTEDLKEKTHYQERFVLDIEAVGKRIKKLRDSLLGYAQSPEVYENQARLASENIRGLTELVAGTLSAHKELSSREWNFMFDRAANGDKYNVRDLLTRFVSSDKDKEDRRKEELELAREVITLNTDPETILATDTRFYAGAGNDEYLEAWEKFAHQLSDDDPKKTVILEKVTKDPDKKLLFFKTTLPERFAHRSREIFRQPGLFDVFYGKLSANEKQDLLFMLINRVNSPLFLPLERADLNDLWQLKVIQLIQDLFTLTDMEHICDVIERQKEIATRTMQDKDLSNDLFFLGKNESGQWEVQGFNRENGQWEAVAKK